MKFAIHNPSRQFATDPAGIFEGPCGAASRRNGKALALAFAIGQSSEGLVLFPKPDDGGSRPRRKHR